MIKLFENYKKNGVEISLINNKEDKKSAISIIDETFKKYGGFSTVKGSADFDISFVIKLDGEVIGTYILGDKPLHLLGTLNHYMGLKGVEGVALAVKPEFRGTGYGNMLKDYSIENSKYDYIWGMQLKDLKNVEDWAKRRRIVFSSSSMVITLQDIKDTFPHLHQTNGINCGSTSLKMLLNYYKAKINPSIDDLTDHMEIDYEFGCTDVRMKKGLEYTSLKHQQIKVNSGDALNFLKNYLKNDRKILLRTLTQGIKHWVVVYDYNDGEFCVADPWLGKIKYNEKEIYSIWEPRNFDGFVVYGEDISTSSYYDDEDYIGETDNDINKIIKLYENF